MPRLIGIIQIALSLVMVMGLATGCELLPSTLTPSSTPTPQPSSYPADISGHVTIAEKVKSGTAIAVPPNKEGDIFWIVDVSVKNNAYDGPVEASLETGYKGWEIIANDKVYRPRASGSPKTHPPMSVALNKTGQFMLYVVVPDTLQISDAQICYQGQQPYSYGELTGGDKVAAYDWGLKKAIAVSRATNIATTESMWVSSVGTPFSIITGEKHSPYNLIVELKPTKSALPDHKYIVELYENKEYRDERFISWNQPELNVLKKKLARFPITKDEYDAYFMEDVSHIFTVKVHE